MVVFSFAFKLLKNTGHIAGYAGPLLPHAFRTHLPYALRAGQLRAEAHAATAYAFLREHHRATVTALSTLPWRFNARQQSSYAPQAMLQNRKRAL
jgi:hypothetical protein